MMKIGLKNVLGPASGILKKQVKPCKTITKIENKRNFLPQF